MKKLLAYIFLSSALAALGSAVFFQLLSEGLRRTRIEEHGKLRQLLIEDTDHEILCLGSSRAWCHFDPTIIEEATGLDCYNGGLDGAGIREMAMLLPAYLERHPAPRMLIVNVDFTSFDTSRPIFKLNRYLPYLERPAIRDMLTRADPRARAVALLPFLGPCYYNDYDTQTALRGLAGVAPTRAHALVKGFGAPWDQVWDEADERLLHRRLDIVTPAAGLDCLGRMIEDCQERDIRIVLVYGPHHIGMAQVLPGFTEFMATVAGIAAERGVPFLRYDGLELCNTTTMFADPTHLNAEGASAFTRLLVVDLLPLLH